MPDPAQPVHDSRPLLGLDTSGPQGGIALYDGQRLSTRSWPAERSHTTTLLAEIHHLLAAGDRRPHEIAAIAVATGPGGFTGLRVGLGVAKGFHLATGVPLLGISTLAATAMPFAACAREIVATVAAGRGRLVWARYRPRGAELTEIHPPRNETPASFAEALRLRGGIVVGDIDDELGAVVASIEGVVLPPRTLRCRQPNALIELAWRRWLAGSVDDASDLEPVYLAR